jgi:GNAT superfamily N-acetyltransferase
MITFQRESLGDVRDEIMPLFERHWREIALNQDKIPLAVNWKVYENLEDAEVLYIFTIRDGDVLAGYLWILAMPHLHYSQSLFATADIIYIDKPYRKGFTAAKLIKFAEDQMKEAGVSVMSMNTKIHKPFDKLLLRLGFKPIERIYAKYLGDC